MKITDTIKTKIKTINWWIFFWIIFIFLMSAIFSCPLLPDSTISTFFDGAPFEDNNELLFEEISSPEEISSKVVLIKSGTVGTLVGNDIFSRLFNNIKTIPTPFELCFINSNKIIGNTEIEVGPKEAGDMSFKYRRLDDNSFDSIYVPLGETSCKTLPAEGIFLEDRIRMEIKPPDSFVAEVGDIQILYKPHHIEYAAEQRYYFDPQKAIPIFLANLFLYFFAASVILSSFITIWRNLFHHNQKKLGYLRNILDPHAKNRICCQRNQKRNTKNIPLNSVSFVSFPEQNAKSETVVVSFGTPHFRVPFVPFSLEKSPTEVRRWDTPKTVQNTLKIGVHN